MKLEQFEKIVERGGTFIELYGKVVEVRFQEGYQVGTETNYYTAPEKAFERFMNLLFNDEVNSTPFVGVWKDEGKIFIENSLHILDRVKAFESAKSLEQLSIYNWEEEKVEWL